MAARHLPLCLLVLLAAAPLTGCGGGDDNIPHSFAPFSYSYLRPLRLNVGTVDQADAWAPGPGDLTAQAPVAPLVALHQMAQDRLVAAGPAARAVFTVENAGITGNGDTLSGLFKIRLDIFTSDGKRSAFAEAAVSRTAPQPDGEAALRAALYTLTKQMMDDMNVELEYQLRRTIGDWLLSSDATAPSPAAVEQQELAPPPGK